MDALEKAKIVPRRPGAFDYQTKILSHPAMSNRTFSAAVNRRGQFDPNGPKTRKHAPTTKPPHTPTTSISLVLVCSLSRNCCFAFHAFHSYIHSFHKRMQKRLGYRIICNQMYNVFCIQLRY